MKTLFHITPAWHKTSIIDTGIDPNRSLGKRKEIWLVDESRIPWALSHCSVRHNVRVADLHIFRVAVPDKHVKRTRLSGIFTCALHLQAHYYASGSSWIEGESAIND